MSYSFFYQAPKRTDADTLIVDGKKLQPNTVERQEAFEKLNSVACQFTFPAPWSTQSLPERERSHCKTYFAKGHFNELDDLGRFCGFMFCSDSPANEAFGQLVEVARAEGFSLHPDVEAVFRKGLKSKEHGWKRYFLMAALIIILIVVLCVIMS